MRSVPAHALCRTVATASCSPHRIGPAARRTLLRACRICWDICSGEAVHEDCQIVSINVGIVVELCVLTSRYGIGNTDTGHAALQVSTVFKQCNNATIVLLLMRLKHQTGEQLMLRELLGTELMRVSRQRLLRDRIRRLQHPPWRFAGCAHPALCTMIRARAQPNMRQTSKVFYRAGRSTFFAFAFHVAKCHT